MVTTEPDEDVTPTSLPVDGDHAPPAGPPAEVAPTGELEAHRARALAAVPELPDDCVLSYVSAACLLGLPIWDVPLLNGPVHATRSQPGVAINRVKLTVRNGRLAPVDCTDVQGVPVTAIARTLVDLGRWASRSTAVVCADAALRDGLVSRTDLDAALDRVFGTSGVSEARIALGFADGRSPGIAASRARVAAQWPPPIAPSRPWSSDRYGGDRPDGEPGPYGADEEYGRYGTDERYGRYGADRRYGPYDPEEPYRPDDGGEPYDFGTARSRAAQRWGDPDDWPPDDVPRDFAPRSEPG